MLNPGALVIMFLILLACAYAPSGSPTTTAYLKAAKLTLATQPHKPAHGLPACLLEQVAHIPC